MRLQKAVLALCALVILLALSYCWYVSRDIEVLSRLLREERKRCTFRQGLDGHGRLGGSGLYSRFYCARDQYPDGLCTIDHVYLNHSTRRFSARVQGPASSKTREALNTRLWALSLSSSAWPKCSQYFDESFIFAVDYSTSDDHYFSMHVHSFIPLYSLLVLRHHLGPPTTSGYTGLLMPSIEDYTLHAVDWSARGFDGDNRFSLLHEMTNAFAGSMQVMPLVEGSLVNGLTTCIKVAHFGVGTVNISDPSLLNGFSQFMQNRLGLPLPFPQPKEPFVCLVRRSSNRRILNEQELVSAISQFVRIQVVQLDILSYSEQVAQMQQFTILAGFHGSELINAIYMPEGSVTIQLVPHNAKTLDTHKYAQILGARGHYLEWHNKYEKQSRANSISDTDNSFADTIVNVEEFLDLIRQALKLGVNSRLVSLAGA